MNEAIKKLSTWVLAHPGFKWVITQDGSKFDIVIVFPETSPTEPPHRIGYRHHFNPLEIQYRHDDIFVYLASKVDEVIKATDQWLFDKMGK